jgi:GAF domain-containing protein
VADASRDPRQAADIAASVGYRPESILCVPLVHDDRVSGVLELLDKEAGGTFSLEDMATLGLFANQAAIAIVQSGGREKAAALLVELLRSLGAFGGAYGEDLLARLGRFAARLDAEDASWRQALDLAGRVWTIASRGEGAAQGCHAILDAVATLAGGR